MCIKTSSLLRLYPDYPESAVDFINRTLHDELLTLKRKIVVLDDDPTGIQTVNGVYVYTCWDRETIIEAFLAKENMFFILTNSRSLTANDTRKIHHEIGQLLCSVSGELGIDFLLLSRSDSTLRGHYPLETETLKNCIEKELPIQFDGEIFCPFFLEGGRYTVNNIHYVENKGVCTPASETEFAKDKTFPFHNSSLPLYIKEKCANPNMECICLDLEKFRHIDIEAIAMQIEQASQFQRIVVNALTYTDLKVFTIAWLRVMKKGKNYLTRCAASLPKIIGGISEKPYLKRSDVCQETASHGGLVIIGSHVQKTTLQLEHLKQSKIPCTLLEFDVNTYFTDGAMENEILRLLNEVEKNLLHGQLTVIYTSRALLAPKNFTKEELLLLSVKLSEGLTDIVHRLRIKPAFLLAKGGITSSDVGTRGLHVKKAFVLGQIKPGIPVWLTGEESKFPQTPYILFPGNVGDEETLTEIMSELCCQDLN